MPAIVSIVPEPAADTTVNAQDPEHKSHQNSCQIATLTGARTGKQKAFVRPRHLGYF